MAINHPLIQTLKSLRGNVRACVYTEPLWGIPFNLYAPYVSVYMLDLGLTDTQIGTITSIGLAFQVLWTLVSGAITDKLGRKRTTLIFDFISWSIPCLIWAVAQNVWYFLAAALVNSVWRVVSNSWQCLLVEDTDPDLLVDVWSWIYIGGLLAAFVAPLTGLLIARYSVVPTMRGLYLLAFVMMTAKFLTNNAMATETRQGRVRMEETRNEPLFSVVRGSWQVLKQVLRTRATLVTAGLMVVVGIGLMVRRTFWPILVTEKLGIPDEQLSLYAFVRSVALLAFYFYGMPRLRDVDPRKVMVWGLIGVVASTVLLIAVPPVGTQGVDTPMVEKQLFASLPSVSLLLVATVLEACSASLADTLLQKLVVVHVDAKERARILALLYALVLILTSPFGWVAGRMSETNRSLPFVLVIGLFAAGAVLAGVGLREQGVDG